MNILTLAYTILEQQFLDDAETCERLKLHWEKLKSTFNQYAVRSCLTKFINAELDCKSPGKRGLGRVTDGVPRLGAFFRKKMAAFSTDDNDTLSTLINTQCLLGYLTHLFFYEDEVVDTSSLNENVLFESWIPSIYSNRFSDLTQDTQSLFALCSQLGTHGLKNFFKSHGMITGLFQSDDVPDMIVNYYFLAGFCLRQLEIKLESDLETGSTVTDLIDKAEMKERDDEEAEMFKVEEQILSMVVFLANESINDDSLDKNEIKNYHNKVELLSERLHQMQEKSHDNWCQIIEKRTDAVIQNRDLTLFKYKTCFPEIHALSKEVTKLKNELEQESGKDIPSE